MSFLLQNLANKLSKKQISPAYFIYGPEVFLIQESLKCLKSQVLSSASLDFNYEVFCCGEVEPENIRSAVETLPVFSEKRIIVCEQAHRLKESDWKVLQPLVQNPVKSAVLVFVSETLDKRKKITKALLKLCEEIPAKTPKGAEWHTWIKWMGQREDLSFSADSIQTMKEYATSDLLNLETEIKKLKNFLGTSKKQVSEQDVLSVVARVQPENVFALSKAIGKKNVSSALISLSRLLEDNQNEVGVLALISRHIRVLARVKEGLKKGYKESTLCAKTGLSHYVLYDYIASADLWTEKKLLSALELLKDTDKALKSSSLPSYVFLENFIMKTCSQ